MEVRDEDNITPEVTSGIRQGCTGSTTLFKPVTFKIIQKLEELDQAFEDEMFKITSLFYADDGMVLINSLENARKVVEEVVNVSRNLGLGINKQKSKIIIFNVKEKPEMIWEIIDYGVVYGEINATDKIKYLGTSITINDSKKCFKVQKERIMGKARKWLTWSTQ